MATIHAFSRAFHTWEGVTSSRWRESAARDAESKGTRELDWEKQIRLTAP